LTELPPEVCTGLVALQKDILMIFSVLVSIKEIVAKGRDFPWPRPAVCPRCEGRRVWCHGFVSAFFDGFNEEIFLRRYRCPECRCVMRARPTDYFERVQASIKTVRSSIAFRLENGRWPPGGSRCRQGHWLRSLTRRVYARFGQGWSKRLLEGFDELILKNEIPVCRRI
jgi:DNA-directed RNA polymerase subunit RPC12/RpoP